MVKIFLVELLSLQYLRLILCVFFCLFVCLLLCACACACACVCVCVRQYFIYAMLYKSLFYSAICGKRMDIRIHLHAAFIKGQ